MSAQTIYALASAPGRAGVAVVRISGPQATNVAHALTRKPLPPPREAVMRLLVTPKNGRALDRALILWFVGPYSFTGEDVVEFHLHGGRAILAGLFAAFADLPDVRPAEPGEFTRRAVENGKMDLTAAEGVLDLIHAETEAQRRQALRQMGGALGDLYENWRRQLLQAQALIEADIDFSDEGDVAESVASGARAILLGVREDIARHLNDARRGERLRDGLHVAIIGAPNAGKSSLLNLLAQRDVAIVSDVAGTTRDVLDAHLDLGGYPVVLADTAGLRDAAESIEAEGIRRAEARARDADFKLAVFDCAESGPDAATKALVDQQTIVVLNKIDLQPNAHVDLQTWDFGVPIVVISTKAGTGIEALLEALTGAAHEVLAGSETPVLTRARHRTALQQATEALDQAVQAVDNGLELALVAESVRHAAQAIGRITGQIDVEDLLDVVFREFCIGK